MEFRHFFACFAFSAIAICWARLRWVGFRAIFGGFAIVAPISYALYVLHFPLAVTAAYLGMIPSVPLQMVGYVAITVAAAWLAEGPFQRWVNRTTRARKSAPQPVATAPLQVALVDLPAPGPGLHAAAFDE
jgi:peptidoglycan/LPS O-acetylase OafA/YrhL